MSSLKVILNKWFTLNCCDSWDWFTFLRIGTALCLIAKTCFDWSSIDILFGTTAIVPYSITAKYIHHFVPSFHWILRLSSGYLSDSIMLHTLFLFHLVVGLLLLLGYRICITAALCWLLQTMILNSSPLFAYGFDGILLSLLFYLFIFELGYQWLGISNNHSKTQLTLIFHKVLQLHVCIIYLLSGIPKARSWVWTEGDLLFNILQHPQFTHLFSPLALRLFAHPFISLTACWFTIIIETGYPFAVWIRGLNKIFLIGILLLHILIGLLMGLWLFAAIMLVFNIAAFGHILFREK